jgi:hypothetical protein
MDVIFYLLFVCTLIIFIRTRKNQVEETMKTKSEKSSYSEQVKTDNFCI